MSHPMEDIAINLKAFYRQLGAACDYEGGSIAGLEYVWNRKGNWPSYVIGSPEKSRIETLAKAMKGGEAPPFLIQEREEAEVLQSLEEAGIRRIRLWTGMALEPGHFSPPKAPPGLEVEVNAQAGLESWMGIVNAEVMGGARMGPEVAGALEREKAFHWLLARQEGEAVGSGLLFTENEIGGIYMVGTPKAHRGKGYASALLDRMISLALEKGCRRLVLHATGMGEGLYQRLGFRAWGRLSIHWYLGG